jgi:phosphoribosylaminoimidazole-succinocarboxamide synthase
MTGLKFKRPNPAVPVRARIRDALAKELPEYF